MFFPWILWFYSFCSGIYISRTKIKNFIVLRKLRRYLEHCFMKHSSSLFVQLEKFLSFLTFEEASSFIFTSSLLPHFWANKSPKPHFGGKQFPQKRGNSEETLRKRPTLRSALTLSPDRVRCEYRTLAADSSSLGSSLSRPLAKSATWTKTLVFT